MDKTTLAPLEIRERRKFHVMETVIYLLLCVAECVLLEDVEIPPESQMMINTKLIDSYCPDSVGILELCPSFV